MNFEPAVMSASESTFVRFQSILEKFKPYYYDEDVCLINADCFKVFEQLSETFVDHTITDPPYNQKTHEGARSNKGAVSSGNIAPINVIDFDYLTDGKLELAFNQIGRITKRWTIATVAWQHAAKLEQTPPIGTRFVRLGVWIKPNGIPQMSGDRPAQGWEAVAILHKEGGRMKWNGGGKPAVFQHNIQGGRWQGLHPTQKPIDLLVKFITLFTDPDDLIFDPFAGVGTTLLAAKKTGRRALGVEINEDYCKKAVERLSQKRLF